MRGATAVILQHHQILPLPRMTFIIDRCHTWIATSPNAASATKRETPTSPTTAPAMKHDCHGWSCSHMKRHLQCAEQHHSPSKVTKYCVCHAKWHSKIWNPSVMIRPWNCKTEPLHSQSLLFPPQQRILYAKVQHFALPLSTQNSPNAAPATKYCACHEMWHSNISKCCACHEKWDSNVTK